MSATNETTETVGDKVVITSALPYVNNVPHLGNIVGCVLSADVYARYLRSTNKNVLFVGGVDEYGTATEMKAQEIGVSCKELCDSNYALHKKAYDWFRISFDCYGRTSQPNGDPHTVDETWPHTRITRRIYTKLVEVGAIIEQEETAMFCNEIGTYVADRFILSTCYHCGSEKADGDQCDACGNLLSADKLINPRYKPNPDYNLVPVQITNLYLDLPTIWANCDLDMWFSQNCTDTTTDTTGTTSTSTLTKLWSKNAEAITKAWLAEGVRPRSISRDLKWGTRIPNTVRFGSKYGEKVFYVWFDAPIGYISIIENAIGSVNALEWWNSSEIVQFMAKDNVPFHSIVFPCTLAPLTGQTHQQSDEYSLPQKLRIASTEYLMYEGGRFSKSKGTGLFCDDVQKISTALEIDPDLWRAYLIYIRPEVSDSNFVLNGCGFVDFVNSVLINNIGNLVHRIRSVMYQYKQKYGELVCDETSDSTSHEFKTMCNNLTVEYHSAMQQIKLSEALKLVLEIGKTCNVYTNAVMPWRHIKQDITQIDKIFYDYIVSIYFTLHTIGELIEPFMPNIGSKIKNDFTIDTLDSTLIVLPCPEEKPVPPFKPLEYIDLSIIGK